ncbi:sensor histidine kinase [Microbacterium cremeum]|uniref:sensor histidine kinase n=1 Tax=Microbacterium cremeum TaxID=2782169 RepID=UPI001886EF47|nr:ATP-binding protein [Microbacterium cremeum]
MIVAPARAGVAANATRRRWIVAVSVVIVSWGLAAASVVLSWVFRLPAEPLPGIFLSQAPAQVQSRFDDIGVVVALIYAPVATVLILRRPQPVAVILAAHAVGSGLAAFGVQYGLLGEQVPGLPLWGLLAYTAGWGFVPGTFLTAIVPLLLLRRGPGSLGRVLIPMTCICAMLATFLSITHQTAPTPSNPLALPWPQYQSFVVAAYAVTTTTTLVISVAAAGILINRYAGSARGSRRPLGWLTLGHVFLTLSYVATVLPESMTIPETVWQFGMVAPVVGQIFYPAAVLVMGLDRRLRGVDVAVSRVLVTAIVAVLAVLAYHLATSLLALAGGDGGTFSVFLVAAVIAVGLHPVHTIVRRRIDLLVFGTTHDPSGLATVLGDSLGGFDSGPEGLRALAGALRRSLGFDGVEIDPGSPLVEPQRSGRMTGRATVIPLGVESAGVVRLAPPDGAAVRPEERAALEGIAGLITAVIQLAEAGVRAKRARVELVDAQHEQRRVLRRELHDGMGPALAGAGYSIAAASNLLAQGKAGEAGHMLRRVEEQLRERERALIGLAKGHVLDPVEAELADGLADLLARFDDAGPRLSLHAASGVSAVDARTRRALLLIASEALVNAVRHARATRIEVRLTRANGTAALEVHDDGVGMPLERTVGVGVTSMREWAASIDADLRVEAVPGRGTHVTVRFAPAPTITPSTRAR